MTIIDIAAIDFAQYQTTPLLSAEATLTLSLDLYNGRPIGAPAHVGKAAKRMLKTANEMKQAFIARVELAGVDFGRQVAFDTACDRFWSSLRQRLGYWMNFAHDGLDLLDEKEQDRLDLEDKREKAATARELDKHIFGVDGLNFLRRPFAQQVALMASRLSFIAASDKFDEYEEVIGHDLLTTLNVLQGRYEGMVHDRSMRDDNTTNLRTLRHTLQRHITLYANAVISMIDEDEPESIQIVLDALRPMTNARVRRSRSGEQLDKDGELEVDGEAEAEAEPLPGDALASTDALADAPGE
ncbi:MAG TPA: hypothetical protein VK034_06995 [Enhygromyxa sp.]|nr:hypothetical protein [Enhygromyxa sp.]